MPYKNSFTTIKQKLFQENSSSALQQSINWIKFIKWDWQYYSRGRSNFQEKPHTRFTRSISADWLSNKQETRRPKETQLLHKRENRFTMNTQKSHISWWIVLWRMNIANFIYNYMWREWFKIKFNKLNTAAWLCCWQ